MAQAALLLSLGRDRAAGRLIWPNGIAEARLMVEAASISKMNSSVRQRRRISEPPRQYGHMYKSHFLP